MDRYIKLLFLYACLLNNIQIIPAAPAAHHHEKEKQAKEHGIAPATPAWMQPISPHADILIRTPALGEEDIPFERENMVINNTETPDIGYQVEGFWASSNNPAQDTFVGQYPFPIAHTAPWPHQQEFIKKLDFIQRIFATNHTLQDMQLYTSVHNIGKLNFITQIQRKTKWELSPEEHSEIDQIAKTLRMPVKTIYKFIRPSVIFTNYRSGNSRFEPGKYVDQGDYEDNVNKILWPKGFPDYYVKRFNVIPARAFYRYVMNLPFQFLRDNAPDAIAQINAFEKEWNNEPLIKAAHERVMQQAKKDPALIPAH